MGVIHVERVRRQRTRHTRWVGVVGAGDWCHKHDHVLTLMEEGHVHGAGWGVAAIFKLMLATVLMDTSLAQRWWRLLRWQCGTMDACIFIIPGQHLCAPLRVCVCDSKLISILILIDMRAPATEIRVYIYINFIQRYAFVWTPGHNTLTHSRHT